MSVVGFDVGNESCIVAVARQRGIDVVLNDESKRETPAIVCFGEKQRFIGTAGAASSTMNPKNSVSQIKRLLGLKFSDPEVQKDIQSFPFKVTEGPDGFPLVHANYLGELRAFTPTQILAMILSNLKSIAEKNLNAAVVDCCIGIPVYFSDLQRRAMLDAATIAGLHPLRLFHETTATALAYGIYKTDLPENDQLNVAFVDVGHASMQVYIAGYKKGQLKILAHSYDRSLGGRDFDEVIFNYFATKFRDEYKIDVHQNARACIRLRAACEKLKKVLSANPEAPLNIECLMDEKDVRGYIKREEFEQISIPILERVKGPLEKALAEAGLSVENIHSVEVVGSGSRVPAIIKILTEFFGKEPRRTMNASECVARGCALQCAILSPTFKVREFQIHESFPFSIALSWKGSAPDSQNGAENQQTTVVFPKGNSLPSVKALTFYRHATFGVDAVYADAGDVQGASRISSYTIGPFQSNTGERAKLKVKVRLNLHGIICLESAMMLEEEVEVPVSAAEQPPKESVKMDTDEAANDSSKTETDVNMEDGKTSVGVDNAVPESEERPAQMETDNKVEAVKKKVKKTNVPVKELVYGGLSAEELQKAVEKEFEMALQDRVMEETKDKKNAVEAFVYDMRNKLYDKYEAFVTSSEKDVLIAKLQEVEDWLYEDGEDETKGVYVAKLEELQKQGNPIEERYKEWTERGPAIDQLSYCINSFRGAALSNDPKFDHIDIDEKQKVVSQCGEAESWLKEKQQQQDASPKYATPVLFAADIKRKAEALDCFCKPIMSKPRPAPPKVQTPPSTPTPGDQSQASVPQSHGGNASGEHMSEEGSQAPPAEVTEPMDTDRPESALSSRPPQLYQEGASINMEIAAAVDRLLRSQQRGLAEVMGLLRGVQEKDAQQKLQLHQLQCELADARRQLQQRQNILPISAEEASLPSASMPQMVDVVTSPGAAPVLANAATSPATISVMVDAAIDPRSPGTPLMSEMSHEEIVEMEVTRRLEERLTSFFQSPEFFKVLATRNAQMLRYGFKGALYQCLEKGWLPKDLKHSFLSMQRVWNELPPAETSDEMLTKSFCDALIGHPFQ